MKSEIKSLFSPDVEDLENYIPEEKDNFCLLLMLLVGPQHLEGEESFEILLYTPKYLIENNKEKDIVFGHSHLLVQEYNYERLLETLKNNFEIYGEDWYKIALVFDRYSMWDFGDRDYPKDTVE